MADEFEYRQGAELPGITLPWTDAAGVDIDFTTGYTFTVWLLQKKVRYTTTTTVTGAVGAVHILFVPGALDSPKLGSYEMLVRARHVATQMDRDWNPDDLPVLKVLPLYDLAP